MSRDETKGRLGMQELTRRGFLWALSASGAMLAAKLGRSQCHLRSCGRQEAGASDRGDYPVI